MVYSKARLEHALHVFRTISSAKEQGSSNACLWQLKRRDLRNTNRVVPSRNCQSWNFAEAQNSSDEDEYSPLQDRKRGKAASRRRKPTTSKRKAADAGETQRHAKKTKVNDVSYEDDGNTGYLTLRVDSEEGRNKLKELLRAHNAEVSIFSRTQEHREEPAYWRSTAGGHDLNGKWSGHERVLQRSLTNGDMDINGEYESVRDRARSFKSTALRSGKIIERNKMEAPKDAKETRAPTRRPAKTTDDPRIHVPSNRILPIANQPTILTNRPFDQNVAVVSNGNGETKTKDIAQTIQRHESPRPVHFHRDVLARSASTLRLPKFQPSNQKLPSRDDSGIMQLETSYAHPINFRLVPNPQNQCHFCTDWTIGILGLGRRKVSVIRNPENLKQLTEIEGGHRAEGHPPTQMCGLCSLRRLMIMRCHSPQTEARSRMINGKGPRYKKIHEQHPSQEVLISYLDHLFPRLKGKTELVGAKQGPLPTCSLCPLPAIWQCCKWQERDYALNPCKVPGFTDPDKTISISKTNQGAPEVISLLDSSDDEEHEQKRSPSTPTSFPSQDSSASLLSQNQSTSTQFSTIPNVNKIYPTRDHVKLRDPIAGCGLQLCPTCYTLVEQKHDGVLDRSKILGPLRRGRLGVRADAEWLFAGSLLEWGVRG